MKIIGAGFGRTGTTSLQLALEKLGFGKYYHMVELFKNPSGVKYWNNASKQKQVDWDELFRGYQAIVDFPGSIHYKELSEYYPESKVILSLRDPESWYKSAYETIFSFDPGVSFKMRVALQAIYRKKARNLLQIFQYHDKSIWGKYFEDKFRDKAYTINKYNEHVETVKNSIPKERLLLHKASDGWEPLCNFLGKKIPNEPYPRTNKRENFPNWAKGVVLESLNEK